MNLSGFPVISGGAVHSDATTAQAALGSVSADSRGRLYRYVMAGTSALVTGQALQSPAQITVHQALVPTVAQGVGSKQVIVTLGAAAAAENLYAEGLCTIIATPGEGYSYGISGHAAVLSGGVATLNLRSDDPIQVAITTGSTVALTPHPCRGVIATPATTLTGAPVGVAVYPIAASRYGWIGVVGDFAVQIDGAPGVGMAVSVPGSGAGMAAINSTTLPIIGRALITGVNGRYHPVAINLL